MTGTRRFALIYGILFLVIGIAGFIPGLVAPHTHPAVAVQSWMGLLLGLFAVNILHNLAHVLFGVWGLAASGSEGAARGYAKATAIIYAVLMVLGLIAAFNLNTLFGLVPLYGNDIWLHALLAAVAAYFGWRRPHEYTTRSAA
ncbi:DUF4383 domain-containing protein [Ramlibacter rhizophilus]|uniref:DUF4383 domain-containing protein n=1 Tax=Ramlibacter rhizophilus TaxID=1781167 RepID=A0A4Z0C397_9BURK|nr:DUF4383 domain-containing protein [Ramlibacter rhizophilus]TFZ04958.1 DUF4383 domain-containing protein [Ramlibacter rhizophilus]